MIREGTASYIVVSDCCACFLAVARAPDQLSRSAEGLVAANDVAPGELNEFGKLCLRRCPVQSVFNLV